MRVLAFSDLHLDAGAAMGDPHPELGSTRVEDGVRILEQICVEPCDVLCFLGDLAEGPNPRPSILRLVQDALRASPARHVVLVPGNHDWSGERYSSIDVVAAGVPNSRVIRSAGLLDLDGLQIGALPWAPPQRMHAAGVSRGDANTQVADTLLNLARGLGGQLDPARPSILLVHWLVAGSRLAGGADILRVHEPLLPVDDLEGSGGWGALVAGHNHASQALGQRTWITGPPLRHSFGEADLDTGYLVIDFDGTAATVERRETQDRRIVSLRLDLDRLDEGSGMALGDADLAGAIVRLGGVATGEQADRLAADGGWLSRALAEEAVLRGAAKVLGPHVEVQREERRRSELTADDDPLAALAEWMERTGVDAGDALHDRALGEARRIMDGGEEPAADEAEVDDDLLAFDLEDVA